MGPTRLTPRAIFLRPSGLPGFVRLESGPAGGTACPTLRSGREAGPTGGRLESERLRGRIGRSTGHAIVYSMPVGRLLWLAVVVCVSMAPARAQRYGEVFGKIVDLSQGGVSDASIMIVDEDTGFRRTAQSEAGGGYAIGSLAPGSYKITVRKEGFRPVMKFGVKVSSGAAAREDFQLPLGSMEESVTVVGTAPALERPDASAGGQFDLDEVGQLPLNGRGVITLLELIPGTNVIPATRGDAGQFTTSGMRPNTNLFTVDGISANTGVSAGGLPAQSSGGALPALSAFGSLDSMISVEDVQDFKLQTSTAVAEFGRMPGASIALSSRAGTDHFHGSAVFRYRNQYMGANNWFANQAGYPRAPLGYEDFAPSFGGPLKRNRTFFFLSYEGIWLNQPYVYKVPVPSTEVRLAVSPAEQAVLNLFPQPNHGLIATNTGEWTGQVNRPAGLTSGSARIDQAVTNVHMKNRFLNGSIEYRATPELTVRGGLHLFKSYLDIPTNTLPDNALLVQNINK